MERKHRQAAALQYNPEHDNAPRLVAKGRRMLAEKIIATARENDVPVVENPELVASLMKLEINSEIPPELYLAVAKLLVFVYKLDSSNPISRSALQQAQTPLSSKPEQGG